MEAVLGIAHIVVAVLLIFLVLIQDSKGGAMGGMLGGGSSNTIFGATGAASFLVKLTRYVAILFAGSCIVLTIMSSKKSGSVVDDYVAPAAAQTESIPAAEGAPAKKEAAQPAKKTDK